MRPLPRSLCTLLIGVSALAISAQPVPRTAVAMKHAKLSAELRELAAGTSAAAKSDATVQVVIQTTVAEVDAVRDRVHAVGGTLESTARDLVSARVPIASLESLASSSAVRVVRRPRTPALFQTTTEGLDVIGAPAWHSAGRKGAGVKVAILDVGFSGYSSLMGTELPNIPASHVQSFSGDISGNGEVHGTGVAEIVHDVAPDAELYLVNFSDEVELENAVDWLIAQHVDIVNTSWGYPCGGPLDGTGRTNDLVKRAADAGILWVTAAGNFAQQHWSATFNDGNDNTWHNFTAGDDGNTVYMNSGEELRVCVEWDEWATKETDLDLYVWDDDAYVVKSSTDDQSGPDTHDPFELLTFTANYSGYYHIGVKRDRGTRNPRMHLFAYTPGDECAIESVAAAQATPRGVVDELRQFRDVVLASSTSGRAWTRAYYQHSAEVKRILLLHPTLAIEAASLMSESRSVLRSVLDHSSYVLTGDYTTRIDAFLGKLVSYASPALRDELAAFRTRASLTTAAGQTAAQYWESLLGANESPLERATFPDPGSMEYTVTSTSLTPPADSAHAFTAGAINWSSGVLEAFSSRGPTADGRRKPDLSAPDGVCTTTYGDCGASGFLGTSAAAPHVTGAAALVRQTYPSMSITGIRNFLTGRAVDAGAVGPDNESGAGRLALGSTSDVDLLPAPGLSQPSGSSVTLSPTYVWSNVNGALSYRVMIAADRNALPSDPTSQTCGTGCALNTTTQNLFLTPTNSLAANTTYYWQVQAIGAGKVGMWAPASFKTMPPPEQTPPERNQLTESLGQWTASASKAVIIAHGWNSAAASTWVQETAQKICGKVGGSPVASIDADKFTKVCQANGWDVWALDWSTKAKRPASPSEAHARATGLGEMLYTNLKTKHYTHIHLIAHSAGSNLIQTATTRLKKWIADEHRPDIDIHETFLDAYEPSDDESGYGSKANWADNYVDTRSLVALHFGLDNTKLILDNAYNIDVTPTGSDQCNDVGNIVAQANCRHSRPYRFYGESIDTSFGDGVNGHDSVSWTAGMGYPLSMEDSRSMPSLLGIYPLGDRCAMLTEGCKPEGAARSGSHFSASNANRTIGGTSGFVTYTGGGNALFDSIKLGNGTTSSATTTDAPSWIVVDVTTTEPVNKLRFNWRFGAQGEGFLRVFVDGVLVRELDQRYVPVASAEKEEIYIGGANGHLAPGTHRIVLRLDGFGSKASGVELTGVELGTVEAGSRRRVMRH
jgi:hypothetical protein